MFASFCLANICFVSTGLSLSAGFTLVFTSLLNTEVVQLLPGHQFETGGLFIEPVAYAWIHRQKTTAILKP